MCGAGQPGFGQVEVLGCVVGLAGWGRAIGCGRLMGVGLVGLRLARRPTGGALEPARAGIGGRMPGLDISA